jgi:hypothetical protein
MKKTHEKTSLIRCFLWEKLAVSHTVDKIGKIIVSSCLKIKDKAFFNMALDNYSILGYYLPSEILCQILSKCLAIDEISHFDAAISNRNKRPLFLDCVGSEACIWLGDKGRLLTSEGLLNSRNIKVRHLKCGDVTDDMALKKSRFWNHAFGLEIKGGC